MTRSFTRKTDGVDINHADDLNVIYGSVEAMSPMTTAGDMVIGGTSGLETRLAKGADRTVLSVDPTSHLPVWTAGVADPTSATGDLLVRDVTGYLNRIAIGTAGQVLTASGSPLMPTWAVTPASAAIVTTTDTTITNTTTETLFNYMTADGSTHVAGTSYRFTAGGVMSWIATSGTLTIRFKIINVAELTLVMPSQGSAGTNVPWRVEAIATIRDVSSTYVALLAGEFAWQGGTTQIDSGNAATQVNNNVIWGWTAQWATANAGNTFTCRASLIERTKL